MINTIIILLSIGAMLLVWVAPVWGYVLLACSCAWALIIKFTMNWGEPLDFMTWLFLLAVVLTIVRVWRLTTEDKASLTKHLE